MASIKCRYLDGTSKICYTTNYVNDIKVNGISIGLVTNYNVNSGDDVEFDVRYNSNTGSYGYNLFFGIKTLVSVEIGNEIDYVGSQMCTNCTALETLKIGSAVKSIHTSAFRNCTSLKTIDFTGASNLLQIQTQAFQNCTSLTRIDFPNTLNNVQPQAFQLCASLKVISFGTDIKGFYRYAFSGCTSLDEIRIQSPECPQFLGTDGSSVFENVKSGGTLYYPKGSDYSAWLNPNTLYSLGSQGWNGVETDNFEELDRLKLVCKYKKGSLIFNPSYADSFIDVKINGVSVGDLKQYHYTNAEDDIVEFSLRGTSIGYRDFWGCDGLVDIKIAEGVTTIGEGVFNGCTSLLSITIPSTVTNIGSIAFGGCSALEAVYVKGQTCTIQQNTFNDVRRNGTLYYPNNTDYSQWLSTDTYYLGYYGWNGVGVGSDFELKIYRFNIAVESLSIPQEGTVKQIEYTSLNIDEISIDAPNWISVVQYSTYFELTIAANTGDARTGTITFTANPNSVNPIVDSIEISQDGLDVIFILGDGFNISYTFSKAGGTYQLPYTAQRISSITWTAPDWLTITNKGTYFNIVAPANSDDERSANIIFKADNIEREFHIYQDGIVPTFTLDKTEVTVNPSGETFTVNYSGTDIKTVSWSISTNTGTNDWVSVVKNNGYFTITVASNTADVRKARVIFTANSGYANTASDTLVINQQALEKSFTLDNYLITFPSEGGVQDVGYNVVNIFDNITFEAPSWITVTVYNSVFRIEVGRTTSTTGRQGTVTFRTGGFVQELVVKQEKYVEPTITVSKTKIEAPYTGLTETVSYTTQGVESIYIISPNWIDVRDYGTYLEINVKNNAEYEGRTGVVEVYGNYQSAYEAQARIEVVQEPMPKPVDPDPPVDPNAPSVGSNIRKIVFEASGGTQPVDFTWSNVSYDDISSKAEATDSWVELEYEGLTSPNPIITQYLVKAVANTGAPRTTYFTFTGSTSSGEIKSETITIYQKNNNGDLPNNSDMSTGCYINLDSYEHTFPVTGGTYFVRGTYGYPVANSGLKTRVYKGAVYPIAWCVTELRGGLVSDDGTEASEEWKITMSENTGDVRECSVSFSYTNSYGESTSVVFTARQEAAEGEEGSGPTVSVFSKTAKIKADGTPEISSFTSIRCGYNKVTILPPVVNGDWITLGAGSTASGTFIGYDEVKQYPISFAANTGDVRTGTITFSGTDASGNTLTSICNITQAAYTEEPNKPEIPVDGDEYIGPIWKDVEYNFGGIEMVEYGIYVEASYKLPGNGGIRYYDKLLFAGRSYARPGTVNNVILVNKICQDYMDIPLLEQDTISINGGYNTFKLKSADGNTLYRQYSFVNDWSYGKFKTGLLSRPILKDHSKVFRNQLLPFSVFGAADEVAVPYEIVYADGTKWSSIAYETRGIKTEMFPFGDRKNGAVGYTINNKSYTISDECVQYVLYYINPWGGYDWFPIRGKVVEKDSMTAYTYTQNFNNQTWDFGKRRYLTEITKHFTLHTQWMSEDESSRMWYLLQSNTVYLHNLVEDKIYPVIITNNEQEHKKKLLGTRISYQIEVDLSQNRERI